MIMKRRSIKRVSLRTAGAKTDKARQGIRKRQSGQKASPKLKRSAGSLSIVDRSRGFLLYSDIFVKKYGRLLTPIYAYIRRNFQELKAMPRGKVMQLGEVNLVVDWNGNYSGKNNDLRLRATYGKKSFFVKVSQLPLEPVYQGYVVVRHFLAAQKNTFAGVKVKAIKPHILYDPKKIQRSNGQILQGPSIEVSNFFPENHILLSDLEKTMPKLVWEQTSWCHAMNQVIAGLTPLSCHDVNTQNAFLDRATNTIFLFDFRLIKKQF